jgi:toxin ParE1/3/4
VRFKVSLTQSALNDLYAINEYYLVHVNDAIAVQIIDDIQKAINNLEHFPERGVVPKELAVTGTTHYRQVLSSVYRIIYRFKDDGVNVVMVIDGRRDVATALMRRQLI